MIRSRWTFLFLGVLVAVLITFSSTTSFSQLNASPLVGSWKGAVTVNTPPGITPFTSLITFGSDHTIIESRRLLLEPSPFGVLLETTGHGSWVRTAAGQIDVHFTFLLQAEATGADVGTDNVHLVLTLDPAGSTLSGTFESTVKDTSGNPIFTASGTWAGSPI